MSHSAAAERYARAIFELGVETHRLAELSEQIDRAARCWTESPALRSVLNNPVLDEDQRLTVLREIASGLGIQGLGLNTLLVLAKRRRLPALIEISRQLTKLADAHFGIFRVHVTSAQPLGESYLQKLRHLLEVATTKTITLDCFVDPSLIAGLVTKIGDRTIDGSVRGRLEALEERLLGTDHFSAGLASLP